MSTTLEAEQFTLFETGIDVTRLRTAREELMRSSHAKNTIKAYHHSWKVFSTWCESAGRCPLPASEHTIELFVVWSVEERRYRLETTRTNLSAIRAKHLNSGFPSPVTENVKSLVSNAARKLREAPAGKAALQPEHVKSIAEDLLGRGEARDLRDYAILLVGFASGWRRSELASLHRWDVRFVKKGMRLHLGASKSDQDGSIGRDVGIPFGAHEVTCPVRALKRWIEVRGPWDGPLFTRVSQAGIVEQIGISGETINHRLKRALELIGQDASNYGAHSLRAGMVTASAENGADLPAIMQRTGHRNIATVMRYVRPAQVFRVDPLAGVL